MATSWNIKCWKCYEFGNGFFQPIVDRYIAGEDVPYDEVKKAWTTTIAAGGPHEVSVMYGQFYETVREVNQSLPEDKKIRVWLGDPPADPADPLAYSEANFPDRDAFFADVVMREVLAKNNKALLVIGAGHFMSGGSSATVAELENREPYRYNVKAFINAYYPNDLFVIQVHWGLLRMACDSELEAELAKWRPPYLLSLRSTPLTKLLNGLKCRVADINDIWGNLTRPWGDAYLYLGQSEDLKLSPLPGRSVVPYLELMLKTAPELKRRK